MVIALSLPMYHGSVSELPCLKLDEDVALSPAKNDPAGVYTISIAKTLISTESLPVTPSCE